MSVTYQSRENGTEARCLVLRIMGLNWDSLVENLTGRSIVLGILGPDASNV